MSALGHLEGAGDRAQVVRARPHQNHDQLGQVDHPLDRHGHRRRRFDHDQTTSRSRRRSTSAGSWARLVETRRRGIAPPLVPPRGERALRVGVDQGDRSCAHELRLHRQMARQRGLARPALWEHSAKTCIDESASRRRVRRASTCHPGTPEPVPARFLLRSCRSAPRCAAASTRITPPRHSIRLRPCVLWPTSRACRRISHMLLPAGRGASLRSRGRSR